ncbi:hypothetical protein D5071_09840 [Pectobacterium carotovorum]|uniref:Uncharacterized protein n=1 Tax=Pectobacterium carotovorum TaxID=554 RepID=A0A419AWM2_PECCA|nr:hypothetical protein D5071_09840 [Pectobacterium carotovorum]
MPRYSAYGLTPSGSAQALFKTLRFVLKLELFRVYIGISPHDDRLIFRRITERSVTVFTIGTGFQCYKL